MGYPSKPGYVALDEVEHGDSMKGFELILALGEGAINRALESTFNFLSTKNVRKHHRIQLPDHDFEGTMAAPRVKLDEVMADSVWLMVNLDKAKFKGGMRSGWSFAYKIKLRSQSLSPEQVEKLEGISDEVREILRLRAKDRTATVRNVMLDFEHSSTSAFDAGRSSHSGATREELTKIGLHQAFSQYFSALRSWENTYSLSFFVEDIEPAQQRRQPTFVPGAGVYSVHPPSGGGKAGSLDLLMMRQGHSQLPATRSFAHSWAGDGQSDGRLVISWRLFLQGWLLPQVRSAYGLGTLPFRYVDHFGTPRWRVYDFVDKEEEEWVGLDRFVWNKIHSWQFFLDTATEQGADKITKAIVKLEGEWIELVDLKREALGGGRWWSRCDLPLPGRIAIAAGSDGKLSFKAEVEKRYAQCTGEKASDAIDIFIRLGGNDISDRQTAAMDNAVSYLRSLSDRATLHLTQHLSQSFLLPGGEQFFYKNARFDEHQNLVFDVTIKSQN